MAGLGFYLGVGLTVLGVAYTLMVLLVPGSYPGVERRPYVMNGIALCILGVSSIGRDLFLPRWAVYVLWAAAGYLAWRANREIVANRDGPAPPARRRGNGGNGRVARANHPARGRHR